MPTSTTSPSPAALDAAAFALAPFAHIGLDRALLELLLHEHRTIRRPALERLFRYYRNPLSSPDADGGSTAPPAQEVGLPDRLRQPEDENVNREIVIENDIAWRIHTLVDFMFPANPKIVAMVADPQKRALIESILTAVFEASGGIGLWQDSSLLGSIYGSVDFLVHVVSPPAGAAADPVNAAAETISIELVEGPRAVPLLDATDYRRIVAYIIHYEQATNDSIPESWLSRAARAVLGRAWSVLPARRATMEVTQIHSARAMQRYEDGVLVAEEVNPLGMLPVVHIQNLSLPLHYDGFSDVEPLIPLQDELNTRLSDRANRVTMQSFRMLLAKGIENADTQPLGPGKVWITDNLDASITPFGGDSDTPSERQHIEELREALDKASGVTPAAAGHIKAKVGNLTSENALRISLMGTIAKVKRKRVTYTDGIQRLCALILHALDVKGVLKTHPRERRIDVVWTDPLPIDETRRLNDALIKAQLGVPAATLLAELGYAAP